MPWLGEGLLLANGKKWARNRRLLTPAFHFDILKSYVEIGNTCADIMLQKIETCSRAGQSFELFNLLSMCTFDILLRCAFSYQTDCQIKGDGHPYVHAVRELSELWIQRTLKPHFMFDFIYNLSSSGRQFKKHCDYVHDVAEKIIAARKEALDHRNTNTDAAPSSKKYLDFIDILLKAKDENGEGLTLQEIRNEVDTFLFAGHDTTTSATSWILYSLAQHPEIQERVRAEISDVMKDKKDDILEWNDLHKLEYMSMCIKDGLRLHCPVPAIGRILTKEMEIDGRKLPIGTQLTIQIYEAHHNPTIWENPEKFEPDRFLPENVAKRDPFAFVAFSAGSRNCIGQNFAMQEMKTLIARLLYRYKLELDPSNDVKKKLSIVMKTETGIKVFARPASY